MFIRNFYPEEIKPSYEGISDVLDIDVDTSLEELSDSLATKESILDQYATAYNTLTTAYESYERVYTNASEVQNTELIAASLEAIAVSIDYPVELTTEESKKESLLDAVSKLFKIIMEAIGRAISWIKKKLGIYKKIFKKLREDYKDVEKTSDVYEIDSIPGMFKVYGAFIQNLVSATDNGEYPFSGFVEIANTITSSINTTIEVFEVSNKNRLSSSALQKIYKEIKIDLDGEEIRPYDILAAVTDENAKVIGGMFITPYAIKEALHKTSINIRNFNTDILDKVDISYDDAVIAIFPGHVVLIKFNDGPFVTKPPYISAANIPKTAIGDIKEGFQPNTDNKYPIVVPQLSEIHKFIDRVEKELENYSKESSKLKKSINTEYKASKDAVKAFTDELAKRHGSSMKALRAKTVYRYSYNMYNKTALAVVNKVMFQKIHMVNDSIRLLRHLTGAYKPAGSKE